VKIPESPHTYVPWFRREEYLAIVSAMADQTLPPTYDEWLQRTQAFCDQIRLIGGTVEPVAFDLLAFMAWATARSRRLDQLARAEWAVETAKRMDKR
jgi:hypothetical protein